jgi:protein SERAC1
VVERGSAILGLPDEMTIPLNGTHQTICQFKKADDRLHAVMEQLSIISSFWRRQVQATQQSLPSQHRLLDQLGESDHRLHKERNPSAFPGTCSWVLDHPDYRKWYEEPGAALMWFSANPGCGKSVMMSSLIDIYEKRAKRDDIHTCYWFFKSDNDEQANPLVAIRGLLRQVLESRRSAHKAVGEYLENKDPTDLQVVWTAFTIAVGNEAIERGSSTNMDGSTQYNDSMTLCFIDGLDECQLEGRTKLVSLISSYFESSRHLKSTPGRFKMLIASRPENWIKVAFDKLQFPTTHHDKTQEASECCNTIWLKGESQAKKICADVGLVIKSGIQDLIKQGLSQELIEGVERQIIAKADHGFLWAVLILQLLKTKTSASQQEIDRFLNSRTLNSVFTELLSLISDAPRTRKLFSIMLAATRPLGTQELSIALALTPEHDCLSASFKPFRPGPQTCSDLKNQLVYPSEEHIRSVGGPFIRIAHGKVYFVHETVREFLLLDEYEDSDTARITGYSNLDAHQSLIPSYWPHSISLSTCHALLLDICVTYLYSVGKLGIKSSLDFVGDVSEFLDYASKSWFAHFQQVADEIQLQNVPYYHNLCHTAFPGFTIWTDQCWGGDHNPLFGFSAEEQQEYYIQYFGLEVGEENRRNARLLIGRYEDEGVSSYPNSNVQHSFLSFSSNPAVLGGHGFPVRADANGFVSLDFRLTSER